MRTIIKEMYPRRLEILAEQVYLSQSHQGKFNYIMGLWALEQGNPEVASRSFSFANSFDYKSARFYNAIALTEARLVDEAVMAWDSVMKYDGENEKTIAERMRNILTLAGESGGRIERRRKISVLPLPDSTE